MFCASKILDLVDLRRRVALGVDGDDLDALRGAVGFDRFLDLVEEVRLKIGDGEADFLGVLRIRSERREQRDGRDRGEQRNFPNTHASPLFVSCVDEFRRIVLPSVPLDLDPLRSERHRLVLASSRTRLANSCSRLAILSVAHRVGRDRDRDHDADDDLLNERRDLQKVEAVAQEADDQDADGRAADASDAARQDLRLRSRPPRSCRARSRSRSLAATSRGELKE